MNCEKMSVYFLLLCLVWCSGATSVQQKCTYVKSTGFVDCRNKNLTTIPILPADTRVLDLSDNQIQRLDQSSFNNSLLINEIYLANNSIKFIHYATFQNLNFLQILDLSDNRLQNVFTDFPVSLEVLYLDRNPLSNHYIFQQRLQYLKYLSLNGVNLAKVPNFSQILPVLKYLDLDNNPSLQISEDDLRPFKALKMLNISPRVFSGKAKNQKCKEFLYFLKIRKIEVKNLQCYNGRKFNLKGKNFERDFENEDTWYDSRDNILNWHVESPDLFDLQTLVSNGLTNFFNLILSERKESEVSPIKIKEPIKVDDYVVRDPEQALRNVFLSGFPLFRSDKKPELTVSSSDAEEFKRFKGSYRVSGGEKSMAIAGIFNFYSKVFRFSCELVNPDFKTERHMIRLYDSRVTPLDTVEKLQFDKLKCTLNESSDRITDQVLFDMVTNALSDTWLEHLVNIANAATVDAEIRSMGSMLSNSYKSHVFKKLMEQGMQYLKSLNINSFDVSPTSIASIKDPSDLESQFNYQLYNIKIYNLFNYTDYDTTYITSDESATSLKILLTSTIYYPMENSAVLAITSKQDPNDVMTFFVSNVEVKTVFEIKVINKVRKLKLMDVNVKINETDQKHVLFITQILKKYLSLELSREFQRTLTFLMSKMDFYSLNAW